MSKRVIFPGTFDPITLGHLDLIKRALGLFNEVIVAVGCHSSKNTLFTARERKVLVEETVLSLVDTHVCELDGLLVDLMKQYDACTILRGLRDASDVSLESQLAEMNRRLYEGAETVFLITSPEYSAISSSLIKEIAQLGGDYTPFVPASVAKALQRRIG